MEINMLRPKPRPKNKKSAAPKKSLRPKARPKGLGATREEIEALERSDRIKEMEARDEKAMKMSYGGKAKVKKMADGGKCRGMGAATRGGNFVKG
jgi:hypothetical protein|tara:strand:+ start:2540 stop:2824 length:285 start_codon:yes stop_codon:yes gene_type:complete